ncbi:hypothetical protein D3C75_1303860 [compost metagenome]
MVCRIKLFFCANAAPIVAFTVKEAPMKTNPQDCHALGPLSLRCRDALVSVMDPTTPKPTGK